MLKILHYIPSLEKISGGVGAYIQLLAQDLGNLCELHLLTHNHEDELTIDNCLIHYISVEFKYMPWGKGKVAFFSVLETIKPDIIHTNGCWIPMSAMAAIWAKEAGYKVIYTPHGMLEPYAIKRNYWTKKLPAILMYQKKGVAVADIVHATAETERDNLEALGWNKNVKVIPNCVQINNITMKTSWERKKNILFLSRVHPKKGVNFLIEAVAQLKNELAGYTVTVAGPGEGSYIDSLKALAKAKGVEEMFYFIGPVFSDKKWELYKQADLFVLPTYSENFGIVVPEALASGTPVITTVGTPWQELNVEKCGWCVEIGTEALVKALYEFVNCSDSELASMGKAGRNLVIKKYDSHKVAEQMNCLYFEMFNQILNNN